MSGALDMALDEYANASKKGKNRNSGPPRRGGRVSTSQLGSASNNRNARFRNAPYERQRPSRGDINGKWSHDLFDDGRSNNNRRSNVANIRRVSSNSSGNSKLVIENLFYEVTQDEIQDLFSECGPVKKVYLHYDRAGRSTGVADVTFENSHDAETALRRYNGKTLEGHQMKIKYAPFKPVQRVTSGVRGSSEGASVLDRLGGARGGLVKQLPRGNIRSRLGRSTTNDNDNDNAPASRGRGRNVSDNRRKLSNRKPVTYDDLDADLDAYMAIDDGPAPGKNPPTGVNVENGMDMS
ncbi:hypothetical protein Glove_291g31 [Diversispora epigaea]|uniref:RRM domain-containing protein n=1 Tax=Diversispora epigaea TaxID=1348612 RepID=A0A397I1X5_9GLOM|nr:hypothetical protein Glove_291g31 [Diversispora epigaea]